EAMEISTKQAKYAKKPNSIVELSQVIVDVIKGTTSAIYHLGEDFVLGIVQIVEDLPGTLEALANMISRPIETAKYIGKAINDSFIRDVIHGDAESRSHWFTYAIGSIFGFKGLDKAGKAGVQAAKRGAQKAGQRLDELLPYHPKHQLAIDGPVPYNVYDGVNLRDQLMVKVESNSNPLKRANKSDKRLDRNSEIVTYDERVLKRIAEDIGEYHRFPTSFDNTILSRSPAVVRSDGRLEFLQSGSINKQKGIYHITLKKDVIIHRSFIPQNDWNRYSQ